MANGKFELQNRAQSAETTLEVLDALSVDETISQRSLAERLGVALGLTNAVLKRCVKKGLLKIQQAPARRYAYYITPKGFAEKSRLTAEYLSYSLQFYRTARQEYDALFEYCENRSWTRVVLVGATELAEIASLTTAGASVEIVGILDPGRNESTFCDLPIYQSLNAIDPEKRPNAVILTDTLDPQATFERLAKALPNDRVLAPKMMRVSGMAQRPDSAADDSK